MNLSTDIGLHDPRANVRNVTGTDDDLGFGAVSSGLNIDAGQAG